MLIRIKFAVKIRISPLFMRSLRSFAAKKIEVVTNYDFSVPPGKMPK